jgi:hypothetical protein
MKSDQINTPPGEEPRRRKFKGRVEMKLIKIQTSL